MLKKVFVCRPEISPKYFDKLKPEPDPIRKSRPDLQLYTISEVLFEEFYLHNDTKIYLKLNQKAQR